MIYDTAIVGGGIAGYTAALTAKNLKLNFIWIADNVFGDKTEKAEFVRNFPAFIGSGKELKEQLEKQRLQEGVAFTKKRVDGIYQLNGGYTLTAGNDSFEAQTVILATGVDVKSVVGEKEFIGRGVSYCAVCDGALYKNREIAAVLFSEKFCDEVEYLASFAKHVHCFCPFECTFRASNITVHHERVTSVTGETRVKSVKTKEWEYPVDGVFFLLECVPPSALCGGLQTENERIVTKKDGSTNLKGLFAAGDVTGRPYQYIKAAGEGLTCAYSVYEYIKAHVR